ncbi:MAG: ABC transporter substrate-binding protein [Firmicutes bacterium]|nr:ABC transporter substrate-binding protein [Bacillota bacterium]
MNLIKKLLTAMMAVALTAGSILTMSSCSNTGETVTVRYLNFKPEIADKYNELAKEYQAETGVRVIVDTAANNTYEQTLMAKMATDEAPTLFQINGPKGYANWKDYCADLSQSELYQHLSDKSLAVTGADGKVYGIPYVVEGYGIIYNEAITDRYFALADKGTAYKSMDEINNYQKLKELVEDMQNHADDLGIDGVFASTSFKSGEDWRWQSHLTNLPLYYEFESNDIDLTGNGTDEITFKYSDQFKNILDLYLNNSVVDRKLVGTKTVADSMAEFALEKCAMVQNGNWAWSQIGDVSGNKVKSENIKLLPIYSGIDGEESQGLCIGTENFYAINKKSSEAEQQAALDFIYWMYSSEKGKQYVTNEFGFIAPFDTFDDDEKPQDPLALEVIDWMNKDGINSIAWNFTIFPSQTFKDEFGSSLLKYAQGNKKWDDVVKDMVSSWKKESSAAA